MLVHVVQITTKERVNRVVGYDNDKKKLTPIKKSKEVWVALELEILEPRDSNKTLRVLPSVGHPNVEMKFSSLMQSVMSRRDWTPSCCHHAPPESSINGFMLSNAVHFIPLFSRPAAASISWLWQLVRTSFLSSAKRATRLMHFSSVLKSSVKRPPGTMIAS